MPKYKECIMTDDKPCTDCNMCDMCDLDPDKICNNCFDCIDKKNADYAGIEIDEILTEENSLVVDELDLMDLRKESENPMEYTHDDGDTLDESFYENGNSDDSNESEEFDEEED